MAHFYVVHGDLEVDQIEIGQPVPNPRDTQVIVQTSKEVGWHTQSGYDYYIWREEQGRWVGVDLFGVWEWLLDSGLILFGRTLTQGQFNKAMKVALSIKEVEVGKTAWTIDERKVTDG